MLSYSCCCLCIWLIISIFSVVFHYHLSFITPSWGNLIIFSTCSFSYYTCQRNNLIEYLPSLLCRLCRLFFGFHTQVLQSVVDVTSFLIVYNNYIFTGYMVCVNSLLDFQRFIINRRICFWFISFCKEFISTVVVSIIPFNFSRANFSTLNPVLFV